MIEKLCRSTTHDPAKPEIVLLSAPPSCGKSRLARSFAEHGFTRINRDSLVTLEKCLKVARVALLDDPPRNIVVDNTNIDVAARKPWVNLAKELGIQIRCVSLDVSEKASKAMSKIRKLSPDTLPEDRRDVPGVILYILISY